MPDTLAGRAQALSTLNLVAVLAIAGAVAWEISARSLHIQRAAEAGGRIADWLASAPHAQLTTHSLAAFGLAPAQDCATPPLPRQAVAQPLPLPLTGRAEPWPREVMLQSTGGSLAEAQIAVLRDSGGAPGYFQNLLHQLARNNLAGALRLELRDGRCMLLGDLGVGSNHLSAASLTLLAVAALAALWAVSAWSLGHLSRPFQTLASAIASRGEDLRGLPHAEQGPVEARAMANAYNRMRQRIAGLMSDQTRMLAAISHDLRTPATRLRLRAEFVRDAELRAAMLHDLDEMDAMLTEALAFLTHDAYEEQPKSVEMTALLQAVCDDYADLGRPVSFVEPPQLRFRSVPTLFAAAGHEHSFAHQRKVRMVCRPNALRRAVNNLIDNALKYGFRAELRLLADVHRVRITVCDQGPGIALAEQDKVMLPFYRVESSRQRATGGMGLGLAIVKAVAEAHRGRIELRNAELGGLEATLELPRDA